MGWEVAGHFSAVSRDRRGVVFKDPQGKMKMVNDLDVSLKGYTRRIKDRVNANIPGGV